MSCGMCSGALVLWCSGALVLWCSGALVRHPVMPQCAQDVLCCCQACSWRLWCVACWFVFCLTQQAVLCCLRCAVLRSAGRCAGLPVLYVLTALLCAQMAAVPHCLCCMCWPLLPELGEYGIHVLCPCTMLYVYSR
jgi:hypothetical protein